MYEIAFPKMVIVHCDYPQTAVDASNKPCRDLVSRFGQTGNIDNVNTWLLITKLHATW